MTKFNSKNLISRTLPRNAIVEKKSNVAKKVERKFLKKEGFWAIVTTIGRDRKVVPLYNKDGSYQSNPPKRNRNKGCPSCGNDFTSGFFNHDSCESK